MLSEKPASVTNSNKRTIIYTVSALLDAHKNVRGDEDHSVFTDDNTLLVDALTRSNIKSQQEIDILTRFYRDILRYNNVLCTTVDHYYQTTSELTRKGDYWLFVTLVYMAFFYADELPFDVCLSWFKSACTSTDCKKVVSFLRHILNEKYVRGELVDILCQKYDRDYIVNEVLGRTMQTLFHKEMLQQQQTNKATALLAELSTLEMKGMKTKPSTKKLTRPDPPVLTKLKPRELPQPQPITLVKKARSIPKLSYERVPPDVKALLQQRVHNKQKMANDREKAQKNQFNIASKPAISDKTLKKMKELVETENAKLDFDRQKSIAVPAHIKQSKQIKLNTASILREDAAMRKRDEERLKDLSTAEVQLHDTFEYERWLENMRIEKSEAERFEQGRKRLEVQLLHEETLISREETLKDKHKIAQEVKAEIEQIKAIVEEDRRCNDEENKRKIDEVQQIKERAQEAKKAVIKENQKLVADVQAESERLLQIAREKAEEEAQRRIELIRQIRELEAIPVSRFKDIDLSETSGTGLLNEMSVIELQERLAITKNNQAEEEERRRQIIHKQRQDKEDMIKEKLNSVQKFKKPHIITADRVARSVSSLGHVPSYSSATSSTKSLPSQNQRLEELRTQLEERKRDRVKISHSNAASPRNYKFKLKPSTKHNRTTYKPGPISCSVPNLSEVGQWKAVKSNDISLLKLRLPKANSAQAALGSQGPNYINKLKQDESIMKVTPLSERLREVTGVDILI